MVLFWLICMLVERVENWLYKWPIFVHTERDTRVCLSRVRYTVMLYGRVSLGVALRIKSVYPTGLTRPRHMDM
ncbi:Ribosomal operon-associated A [Gossypium arboreum]|uniref:Ribosomal operon-associated A n=1 Tax=Gossypium arboreum TaxID=29729 RepID=A0A0B0PCV9_GOSAR|nr:Ribosomal operon-associated A [Gossypium arboreum]